MKYSIIYDQVFLICLPIYYLFSHMFSSRSHICLQQDEEMFCWNKNVWGSKHENPQRHLVITSARLIKSNISVKYWKSYKWWLRNLYFFTNISNCNFLMISSNLCMLISNILLKRIWYWCGSHTTHNIFQFYDVVMFMRHQIKMTLKHFNTRR